MHQRPKSSHERSFDEGRPKRAGQQRKAKDGRSLSHPLRRITKAEVAANRHSRPTATASAVVLPPRACGRTGNRPTEALKEVWNRWAGIREPPLARWRRVQMKRDATAPAVQEARGDPERARQRRQDGAQAPRGPGYREGEDQKDTRSAFFVRIAHNGIIACLLSGFAMIRIKENALAAFMVSSGTQARDLMSGQMPRDAIGQGGLCG